MVIKDDDVGFDLVGDTKSNECSMVDATISGSGTNAPVSCCTYMCKSGSGMRMGRSFNTSGDIGVLVFVLVAAAVPTSVGAVVVVLVDCACSLSGPWLSFTILDNSTH